MFWILILLLLVSRAIFVIPVTLAHNRYNDQKLSMREMGVIWWAGMMRGAVSGAPLLPLAARACKRVRPAGYLFAMRLGGMASWSHAAVFCADMS
jgi:NhaP-type Na+/H+ or K+/H+ antiporter